ncbi:hypothetical protein J3F84DRAFT_405065 [Trichoderma pleuroticola]
MTDVSVVSEENKRTVVAAAQRCQDLFNECLLRASSIHPRDFSLVEDQVARFSTWTTLLGVFAPGRASMDHRLRYAPMVHNMTIGLLEALNCHIQILLKALRRHAQRPETHTASAFNEELQVPLGHIAAEISRLNKTSNMIREASQESQNVRAKAFQIRDEEGNDAEPLLLGHYKRYIADRFPTASAVIQQRLADAMILRRNDSSTQASSKAKALSQARSATTLRPEKFKMAASRSSVVSAGMTVALGNHEALKFPMAPGLHAKRKYEHFRTEQLTAHQAILAQSDEPSSTANPASSHEANTRDAQERFPAGEKLSNTFEPDVPAPGEIPCPYCLCTLPVKEVFDQDKWQNHVTNDLDPYVCLFEECNEPDELYKHSKDWISHMRQHAKGWICPAHRELGLFQTRESYMQHMRDIHNTVNDSKLRSLARINARKSPKLFLSCPLCGRDESEMGSLLLTDHITGHLRSLAIRSLPSYYDDTPDDVESEEDGSHSSQPRTRSTINLLDDDTIPEFQSPTNEDLGDVAVPSTPFEDMMSDQTDFEHMSYNPIGSESEHFYTCNIWDREEEALVDVPPKPARLRMDSCRQRITDQ